MAKATTNILNTGLILYRSGLTLYIFLMFAGSTYAEDMRSSKVPEDNSYGFVKEESTGEIPAIAPGSGFKLVIFPKGEVYPHYIADTHRVGFGFQRLQVMDASIADSGTSRYNLKAGGRFGLLKIHPYGRADSDWQLNSEAGLDAQFDTDRTYDCIGWDGNYGLLITRASNWGYFMKFGVLHLSSHVGDEYAERTGRRRIEYTRHEVVAGLSRAIDKYWLIYSEVGLGYELRNKDIQEPGRLQLGLQYEDAGSLWKGRMGWYSAVDISTMEELDWRIDTSVQLGLIFDLEDRTWRLGIEYYDGRPTIGEFFQYTESYISLALWLDL